MSDITLAQVAQPSAPASGNAVFAVESTNRRPTLLDDKGVLNVLSNRDLPNAIRNSGFWFAQRQVPGTLTTYSSATARLICADGWGVTCENASAQYQRTDTNASPETGLASRFYGNFTKITSTGKLLVTQCLEGSDATQLRGRTVRVTAWMKQLVGASPVIRLGLVQLNSSGTIDTMPAGYISAVGANGTDPTLGTNLAYIAPKSGVTGDNCTANGNAYDCTLSSSWQRFSGVFDVPTNCKNLVVGFWGNAQFAATNGFALTQVALTDGYEIQDWSPLSYQQELARVERHYFKTFDTDTAPAQNAGASTGAAQGMIGKAAATALAAVINVAYRVPLRVAGVTITQYSPESAAAAPWRTTGTTPAIQTAQATTNSTTKGITVTATGDANGAVGDRVHVHLTVDCEL